MPSKNNPEELRNSTARMIADHERRQREEEARTARVANEAHLRFVQQRTEELEQAKQNHDLADARLENWENRPFNRDFLMVSGIAVAGFALWFLAPFVTWGLDMTVFGDISKTLAKGLISNFKQLIGENWILLFVTCGIPFFWIVLEAALGYGITEQRKNGNVYFPLIIFAVLFWLAVPALIVSYALANSGLLSGNPGTATRWALGSRIAAQGAFALGAHGVILWYGNRIVVAFGFWIFKLYQFCLRFQINRLKRQIARATTEIETEMDSFYRGVNNRQNEEEATNLFGARTRRVVNEDVFEQEVIEEPLAKPKSEASLRSEPSAANEEAPENFGTGEPDLGSQNAQNTNPGGQNFGFDMSGEDEVRP